MKNDLHNYKKYVQRKLKALLPIFANSSTGNFKKNVAIPSEEDEFTELYVGIQVMLDVIREKIDLLEKSNTDLEEIVHQKTKALEEAQKLANIGSWEWDLVTEQIYWSRELYKIYDINPKNFINSFEEYLKLVHQSDRFFVNATIQKALHHKKAFHFTHRIVTSRGEVKVLSCKGKTLKNKEGVVVKMIGTVQDITHQKKIEENLEKRVKERTKQINKVNNTLLEEIENRKLIEEELRYEKEKIQNYLNIAKIIFIVIDRNQRVSMVNKKGVEILGYTEEQIIGKHWFSFTDYSHKNLEIRKSFKDLIAGRVKAIEYYENFVYTETNEPLLIAWHITLIKDKHNHITGVLCAGEDITKSSKTVEQLKESEEKYRTLVETMNEGVMTVDCDDVIQFVNKKYCELTGYSQEELIGQKANDLLLEKSFYPKMEEIIELRKNKTSSQYEVPIVHKSGSIKWMLVSGTPLYDKNGEVIGSIGIHTDINERRKIEKKFHIAVEAAPNSMIMVDQNGRIEMINSKTEEMFGYKREELIGEVIEKLVPTRFRSRHTEYRKEYYNDSQTRSMGAGRDLYGLHKSGIEFPIEIGLNPIQTEEGKFVLASIIDITERKKNEQELIKAKEIAEESSKSKELFFTNMSHEIRTPMNGIVGLSDLLAKTTLNDKQSEYLGAIRKSSKNLLVIINDLLDFSKIEAGKIEINKSAFNLHEVVHDAIDLLKVKAEQKGLTMETEISGNIPPVLMGDAVRINQILTNLLSNSLKFTLKGGVKIVVQVKSQTENKLEIKFDVIDTGIGIPQKMYDKIFDVFVQAHSNKIGGFGGTGLGLAIVKKLVTIMNGNIYFTSKEDQGTTFTFSLPFEKVDPHEKIEPEEVLVEEPLYLNVLVAEDNSINQLLVSEILAEWKCAVDMVENGVLAVEKVKTKNYDVILMDMQMPELSGVDATKLIRGLSDPQKNSIPIIALTAHATQQEKTISFSSGVNEYITKPFSPAHLYSKIVGLMKDRKRMKT